ncbi:minor capsid protein [Shimazuella kribbensis]|uniref:minor capsid protein n=1 Tax=Shimazuella kribbensis TaxID=139808 RepID=UPI00040809C7|nr:minor capsid protein [Shimazuella kribbensis]
MRIRLDLGKIPPKFRKLGKEGQVLLDQEVLKDSNYYAPQDIGNLIQSGIRNTVFGSGKVIWNTVYARRLYYNPQYNFSKDKNPNADGLWFRRAKSYKLKKWIDQLDKLKKRTI